MRFDFIIYLKYDTAEVNRLILNEFSKQRMKLLNKMSFPYSELPLDLRALWLETVDFSGMKSNVTKETHEHSFTEIHFVFSGTVSYDVNGSIYRLGEGKALVIPANIKHNAVCFSENILKTAAAFTLNIPIAGGAEIIDFGSDILMCFEKIFTLSEDNSILTPHLISNKITEILYSVFKSLSVNLPPSAAQKHDPRFLVAKAYIENRRDKIISCDEVARECCLSTKQLSRIFKAETGKTPSEYIIINKIKSAQRLLSEDCQYSIKEIGYLLGFENESGFIAFFKRHCGMPPGAFRKEMTEK